jgi:hypothetical protein
VGKSSEVDGLESNWRRRRFRGLGNEEEMKEQVHG